MKKYLFIPVLVAVIGFGYYAISPLFRNTQLDEQVPLSDQAAQTLTEPAPTGNTEDTAVASATPISNPEVSSVTSAAPIVDTLAHPASGTARIISVNGTQYVRYENFRTINGPDIHVYLSKDLSAKEYVDLGKVKATEGNINYEIPAGINPAEYPYVLVWCKAFGVLFNSAKLY